MTLHALLTSNPLTAAGKKIFCVSLIAFAFGQEFGGIGGGLAGAISGMIVAIVGQLLSHRALVRKQRTDGAISLDQERDQIMERANKVHQEEVEFYQSQVVYHENLELASRQRLHAMAGELQRCVAHIRVLEVEMAKKKFVPPSFTFKSFAEIVEMYPLPDPPTVSSTKPMMRESVSKCSSKK